MKEEAAEGSRRGILVPALIQDVAIPLGFRRFQAAQLVGWKRGAPTPEFEQLLASVEALLNLGSGTEQTVPERSLPGESGAAAFPDSAMREQSSAWGVAASGKRIFAELGSLWPFSISAGFPFVIYLLLDQSLSG
ncbi:MAG TPA: hypothetical protein VFD27_16460 [Chthoniobacteraceae bacterium]|nr:hypothetical protein [Chthoniobacteraceae bacterium]